MMKPISGLPEVLARNQALREAARKAASARFQTLAPGETASFELPASQPDLRDCYVVIASCAHAAFGTLRYHIRRVGRGVEVTRKADAP
jgi:hypothetical protein